MKEPPSLKELMQSTMDLKVHTSEDQLVIGLDFGTTFSGIAYAFKKGDKPDVVSILSWPGICTYLLVNLEANICSLHRYFGTATQNSNGDMLRL
jgi:hypothetical protein